MSHLRCCLPLIMKATDPALYQKKNFQVNKRWAPSASRLKQPPRAKQLADDNSYFIINNDTTQKDRQVLYH